MVIQEPKHVLLPQLHSPLYQWAFQDVEVQRRYKKPFWGVFWIENRHHKFRLKSKNTASMHIVWRLRCEVNDEVLKLVPVGIVIIIALTRSR